MAAAPLCRYHVYRGTGAAQSITGLGNNYDLYVIKSIASGSWRMFDSTRGATKFVLIDSTSLETTDAQTLTSFDADGFSLGTSSLVNTLDQDYLVMCFKKAAGFLDIVTSTGTGAAVALNHALGCTPKMMWHQRLDTLSDMQGYHYGANAGTTPQNYYFNIGAASAAVASSAAYNNTAPTSTQFTVGTRTNINASGGTYVHYIWGDAANSGNFIDLGYFTTDGSGNATISTAFDVQGLCIKGDAAAISWRNFDAVRGFNANPNGGTEEPMLLFDTSGAQTFTSDWISFATNQFQTVTWSPTQSFVWFAFNWDIRITPWKFPAAAASETISGGNSTDWASTGNVFADDTTKADWTVGTGTNGTGPWLKTTDFSFSADVPVGAAIKGVQHRMGRNEGVGTDNIFTTSLRLIKGGTIQATNVDGIAAAEWTTTEILEQNGTPLSLWGTTLTEADVTASNFGAAVSVNHVTGTTPAAFIDYVQMRIVYIPADPVSPNNCTHAHAGDNATLSTSGGSSTLAPDATAHAHTADNDTLAQVHALALANAAHAHAAANATLAQVHALATADALHAHSAANDTLSQNHALSLASAAHAHSAGGVTFTQAHVQVIADALHAHAAENVSFATANNLSIANALHAHASGAASFVQLHAVTIQGAAHAHSAQNETLSQVHAVVVANALHAHTAGNVSFAQFVALVIANAAHAIASTAAGFAQAHTLSLQSCLHTHTAQPVTLQQVHILGAANALHAHTAPQVSIEANGVFIIASDRIHYVPLDASSRLHIESATARINEIPAPSRST